MPTRFFNVGDAKDVMNRYLLIATEFGFYPPDDMPWYRLQQLSEEANNRRNKKIEAAEKGMIYTG